MAMLNIKITMKYGPRSENNAIESDTASGASRAIAGVLRHATSDTFLPCTYIILDANNEQIGQMVVN
jgi:hypothetical protein